MNCRVSGDGYPVVFLHGFLESMTMWEYLNLDCFKSILIDLPGHGASSFFFESDFSLKEIAVRVKNELRKQGVLNYSIVGHSLGGYIGIELMKMDEKCEKIVFLNSNFWEDDPLKKIDRRRISNIVQRNKTSFIYEAIPHLFFNPEKFHKEVVGLINEAKSIKAKVIANYSIAMSKRLNNDDFVKMNASRVCVIQGVEDTIVPVSKMDVCFDEMKFVYQKLSPCGHMSHIERNREVEKIIADFLRQ